ncbi:hypothetical protein AWB79_01788 [Caballeronia hypogeia]|uniref:Uracil DNA glycosylase superfamily protein n=1 Tax=Caballeronia hypogeia TaxID=1777140 RepID=A0A158A233_9BURK|nr:hypothetical protein [Caballeronia hypogeia]SAK51803.1 hypothetical protein AWB79_01788 [Caballeronia hypogeia]
MLHFDPDHITSLDASAIVRYHARPFLKPEYRLQTQLGPQPYEGDVATARVLVLMNNPGFGGTSTSDDHRFQRDGWPYASLHPEAPAGMRDYSVPRFRDLIAEFGAQHVSRRLAMLQIHPWASAALDDPKQLALPSMALAVEQAKNAIARGALVLIGRGAWYWLPALRLNRGALFEHRVPRNPYWNHQSVPAEIFEAMRSALE